MVPSAWVTTALITTGLVGSDFRIYYRAVHAWLAGGDPWEAGYRVSAHFGAPPSSLVPLLPFAVLTEDQAVVVWVVLCGLAGTYVLWRLHLGPEWILFPPLVAGIVSGNPDIPLLALLLSGASWVPSVAVALKAYAIVPLLAERRWGAIAVSAGVVAVTVLAAPGLWVEYVQRFGEISGRLLLESGGGFGALHWWPLVPPTVIALLVIARYDLRAAGWLAVPALWPASEWHWSTFALPVMTPWLGMLLTPDIRGLPAGATWVYAAAVLWHRHRARAQPGHEILTSEESVSQVTLGGAAGRSLSSQGIDAAAERPPGAR